MPNQVVHLKEIDSSRLDTLKRHHPHLTRGEIVTFLIKEELERLAKQPVFVSALSRAQPIGNDEVTPRIVR